MKSLFLVIIALATFTFGRPDPSGTVVSEAALFDHNEQGGLRWKISDSATEANATIVGYTDVLDTKLATGPFDAGTLYTVAFVVEYQSKQIDSMPIPGYPTCYLTSIKVHADANSSVTMPIVPVYQTSGTEWVASDAIAAPSPVSGEALNSPSFGMSFRAAQANDGTVFLNVRVRVIATPI